MASLRSNRFVLGLVLAIAVVVAAVVVLLVAGSDDDETTATEPSTTTTTEGSTTTPSTARPSVSDAEAATIVWPDPEGELTYDDSIAVVRDFAVELIGFEDPLYGAFQQGDDRSGEVEVRALQDGPATTVLVRQMSDDHWYVIAAVSSELELDTPTPGSAIDHPLQVAGRARAFEGQVRVAVYERGSTAPLGEGFVTASGTEELGPFAGDVSWANPGGGWGSVVLTTASAEDGSVWTAMAIPVGFIGGD